MSKVTHMHSGGKRGRHSVDGWDKQSKDHNVQAGYHEARAFTLFMWRMTATNTKFAVMERDLRLTGYLRGQTDVTKAPSGFELSNRWKV